MTPWWLAFVRDRVVRLRDGSVLVVIATKDELP